MTLNEIVSNNEIFIRLITFFGFFVAIATWEHLSPKRALSVPKGLRWLNNLGIVVLNSLIVRLLFPAAAVGLASFCSREGWGLLNHFELHSAGATIFAVIVLDFIIYLQHVLVHSVPALWRLHRVHHADLDYDITTGTRFHPLEIVLSMLIKMAAIIVLGPSVVAVIIFEVLLNATAMFNHGNIHLPKAIDRILRHFIVTPDMHRVHHSVEDDEANSNFGFNLPWWDRCLGTYKDQPRGGHEKMIIGIHLYRDPKQANQLPGMLALPFKGKVTDYTINRRQWSELDEP